MEIKKLYRSETNKVFAGICGGFGEFFGIDPVPLRVAWLLVVIFTGVVPGLVAYIVAIFIIPRRPFVKVYTDEQKSAEPQP